MLKFWRRKEIALRWANNNAILSAAGEILPWPCKFPEKKAFVQKPRRGTRDAFHRHSRRLVQRSVPRCATKTAGKRLDDGKYIFRHVETCVFKLAPCSNVALTVR